MVDPGLDLDAYLARIGYQGRRRADIETLRALHRAHVTSIPFENLDILLGKPIRLDLDSLTDKLVRGGRGGYCFEHNTLFAAVLETLGFEVRPLAARVRVGATPGAVTPRTHMLLEVRLDDEPWLADVGFGANGPLLPIPRVVNRPVRAGIRTHALRREGEVWVLRSAHGGAWDDLYAFTLEPQHAVDFEVANHYTSTHPASRFTQVAIAQRVTPDERYLLVGDEVWTYTAEGERAHAIGGDAKLLKVLRETFGLELPRGTRFRKGAG